jgi:hypothetical protein
LTSQSTRGRKDTGGLPRSALASLPYRGTFGEPRPVSLASLPLPPQPMVRRNGLRPLKAWRYVGAFGPELMACICALRIGPARQSFWAVWDRQRRQFREGRAGVALEPGRVRVLDGGVQLDLALDEEPGVETVCCYEPSYAWTRKQGGIQVSGTVNVDGALTAVHARAIVDDTAGYYPHHTSWWWSAGVGFTVDWRPVAWNLVEGVNDPPRGSERTLWVEGEPHELPPVRFSEDLGSVGELRFHREALLERRRNLLLVRSNYRQPFGTFSGVLPDGVELAEGYGVMEAHDVRW